MGSEAGRVDVQAEVPDLLLGAGASEERGSADVRGGDEYLCSCGETGRREVDKKHSWSQCARQMCVKNTSPVGSLFGGVLGPGVGV